MSLLIRTVLLRRLLLPASVLSGVSLFVACDGPAMVDGGTDGGTMDASHDAGTMMFPDGTVFCSTDEECDDGVACTRDSCAMAGYCRNLVDPASCDDGIFCNGVEQCDPRSGCVVGLRETCNDDNVCTVDRCNEETKSCDRFPRDQDDDGDADWFCEGGTDCDDGNPLVSGLINEVCDDFIDNDCDEEVDEPECGRPRNDTCDDPLDVSAGGFYLFSTNGAAPDYPFSCRATTRDLVAEFTLTERRSITIEGEGDFFSVALSLRTDCTDVSTEVACEYETFLTTVIRRRALEPGTYYVILNANSTGDIGLTVTFGAPIDPPTNDTCASPLDVSAGGSFPGSTVEAADDLTTSCGFGGSPDLVYTFTTTAPQNVRISALEATGQSMAYSIRTDCAMVSTEMRCDYGNPAEGTFHQLPAGTYFLVVEGPARVDVDFTLDVMFLPPTPPLRGDTCSAPIILTPNGIPVSGTFVGMENDHDVSCGYYYRDVVYQFTLGAASDLTVTFDAGMFANVSLRPTCDLGATQIRCTDGNPVRQRIRNVAGGTYYLIVESSRGAGFTVSVNATTPPTSPVVVSGNDTCAGAYPIPAGGGLFSGTTATLTNAVDRTRCGGGAASNDAAFVLTLASRSRVVASTDGSSFDTVLHVHRAMCVSGAEIACDDDGGAAFTSLIDMMFDPGTYYIIVDGFGATSAGNYLLEVLVTP